MGREALERLWVSIVSLGARRLLALAFVGLGVMLVVGVGAYYLSRPQQEILYSGLTRDDVGRIGSALKDAGIDFDVSADGTTVSVDYGQTAHARMLLAEKGLPQSADSGYELFNQIGSFGLTSFMQDVTKTRALEGELARTIQSLNGIKAARVHLVLPDRGSFRSDQQPASASVVISTDSGDTSPAQAIRHLVAAAVPGLKIDNVTVLNTDGAVLASGDDLENASAGKMAMVEQTVNQDIEAKIRRTLTPYLGVGNFQVSVVSRLNMDRTTTSETIFDPSSRVERSIRTVKENALTSNTKTDGATGVAGNLPDQKGLTDGGNNSNEANDRREELTNYEVSSKTIETAHDGFTIENLSIAVLINKARLETAATDGTDAVPVEHQLMDIEQLASSAAGFSKERGDQLKVAAVSFVEDTPMVIPEPGIFSAIFAQLGSFVNSIALIVVAIVTVLFGFRPAVKAILASRPAEAPSAAVAIAAPQGDGAPQLGTEGNVNLIEDVTKRMNRSPQKRLEQIVEYDEEQAAAILRQWMQQDEAA